MHANKNNGPAIEVADLRKTYRDGMLSRRSLTALKGVSFHVDKGEIFGLLGPNGAGKTTLIKILLGIVRKSGGSATLLGYNAGDRRGRKLVGYLPEHLRIPRHLNAHTALELYGNLSGLSNSAVRAQRGPLLELVGLADRAKDPVKKYSKGMVQRLGLAQALLHDPQLLIFDEPTDGLDPVGRRQVRSVLTRLKEQGRTIFLNSHILQEVELICDRVAILDRGELRRVGPVAEITSAAQPSAAYASVEIVEETAAATAGKTPQRSAIELELHVAGEADAVRLALDGRPILQWRQTGAEAFHVSVGLRDQAGVDRCVDALRAGGVSIVGLSRRRATLEDAFLDILSDSAQ